MGAKMEVCPTPPGQREGVGCEFFFSCYLIYLFIFIIIFFICSGFCHTLMGCEF